MSCAFENLMKTLSTSSWQTGLETSKYPELKKDIQTEVAIVGGGLAGIVTAYLLARARKKVVLLERHEIGSGVTAYTTAFLTQVVDTAFSDLQKMFGPKKAELVWESGATAIATLEEIIKREKIECDFERCSAHIYARTERREFSELKKEEEAAHAAGFAAQLSQKTDLSFSHIGCLTIPEQAKFHPLKFLHALAQKAVESGAEIYEHTAASELSETGPVEITTKNGFTVAAQDVITTTYESFQNPKATHFKKGMYRSYVLEVEFPKASFPEGLYWDMSRPYSYFRIDRKDDHDRMILGGADHRAEIPVSKEKNFHALEERLAKIAQGKSYKITRKWDGPILESSDGLPLIGAYASHRYTATAFSGNGMTYSVVAALLFRDLLTDQKNPWTSLYAPKRKLKLSALYRKGVDYIQEFFGGAVRNLWRS